MAKESTNKQGKKTVNSKKIKNNNKKNENLKKTIIVNPNINRKKVTRKAGPNLKGEKQIETFLKNMNFEYTKHKKIFDLKGDSKEYRKPDFYLPKYNLSIEYFGSWSEKKDFFSKKEVERFLKKVFVYHSNKLNCVFIYPKYLDIAPTLILKAVNKNNTENAYQDIMFPWMNYDRIEEPLPEDFINKPLRWKIEWLDQAKIEPPLASDFEEERKPLDWYLPWLYEEKIDEPLASDFIKKEKRKVVVSAEPIENSVEPKIKETNPFFMDNVVSLIGLALIIAIIVLIVIFILMIINFGF